MWWQYLLVFVGTFLVDVFPIPLPPACVIMMVLQINFGLNIWLTIALGVIGSVMGRAVMTLWVSKLSKHFVSDEKQKDAEYLGKIMKENKRKGQGLIFLWSLLPMPTTPLFIAGGMAGIKLYQMIPAFFLGKLISDSIAVAGGMYAARNTADVVEGMVSWKSVLGILLGLLLMFLFIFVDWRSLLQQKKIKLTFHILQK